ncbi:GTP cyclohydrolase I [Nocardia sp. NPDC050793]|uniref:GTP cyclohydrolase I n=1 Tax=Nocardia sp. NPDC050793 TaxID=3155159 RepID=UPI0033EF61ED
MTTTQDGSGRLAEAAIAVSGLLRAFDIDEGAHTADTPLRVAKAWAHLLAGYEEDPADHLSRTFPAPDTPGPVIVSGIRLASVCAHHLLPFTGSATVAYQPVAGSAIVGLSKLSRVVRGYARRLQVQERLGSQVADAVTDRLASEWVCVVITAEHQCMSLRGIEDPGTATTTRTVRGAPDGPTLELVLAAHRDATRSR